ncbi:MAG: hypothetical protein FJY86_02560 [Candidatus Diapherotrites archaeon]|uniref:Uncharacterized protein n=1 Tax=Candidatus Iainarchaeum sp. TaxID=3101447 RepID=A0A8T4CB65_9ARCH|nr:hypothetical protein [Candidatus Diapherotrites archaeon]
MHPNQTLIPIPGQKPWVLSWVTGLRPKNGSPDTLKKQWGGLFKNARGKPPQGFIQVLPSRVVGSSSHLEWSAYATLSSLSTNTSHFRQLDLEFLSRVAGTFQWKDVLAKITLLKEDDSVIVVGLFPREEWDAPRFSRTIREWGLSFSKKIIAPTKINDIEFLEKSALAGLY